MPATVGFWTPSSSTPPPLTGALDSHAGNLWSVWSVRLELSAYAGPLVRVRRASDNAEMDVYPASGSLALDSAALLAWSGSGVSAYVKTVYDQSGNGHDQTQATAGNQAMIVNAGTYLGYIKHDGVDDYFDSTSNPQTGVMTMYMRLLLVSSSARQMQMLIDNGTDGSDASHGAWLFDYIATGSASGAGYRNAILSAGGANIIVNQTASGSGITSAEHVMCDVMNYPGSTNADRVPIYVDGSVVGPAIATGGAVGTGVVLDAAPVRIGASISAANPSTMEWKRAVLYSVAHSSTDVGAISAVL